MSEMAWAWRMGFVPVHGVLTDVGPEMPSQPCSPPASDDAVDVEPA